MLSYPTTTPGNNNDDGGDDGIFSTEYSIQGLGPNLYPTSISNGDKKEENI